MAMTNIAGKCSMHIGKQYSVKHNLGAERTSENWNKDGHIDASRTPLNVVLTNTPLKDFFSETFGEAIENYNEKNAKKHPDRVMSIDGYYNEQKSKVQEAIVQMSDHNNYVKLCAEVGQQRADEIHKQFLLDVFYQWQKENPSLKIFSSTIHFDETKDGCPHLHLDFLPVAESNRGLTTKVSMDGAMKQLGFVRESKQKFDETPYKQWLREQREKVEQLASNYITVIPSEPTVIGHKQPQEHKAKEQKKNLVQKIIGAFTEDKKIATAQAVIDNAEKIKQTAKDKAKEITDKAKVEQLKAKRDTDKATAEKSKAKAEQAKSVRMNAAVMHNNKVVNAKRAKLDVTVEQEVQKRTAPNTFWQRQQAENDRYRHKQMNCQEELQQAFEKIKHKTVQRGR